jgi:hypothetical protein
MVPIKAMTGQKSGRLTRWEPRLKIFDGYVPFRSYN